MLVVVREGLPEGLKDCVEADSKAVRRMLNGYRNRLTEAHKLVLTQDENYCGQAFCYPLLNPEPEAQQTALHQKLLAYETPQQKITQVQNNFVLLAKDEVKLYEGKDKITVQELKAIMGEFGDQGREGAVRNLVIGMFASFEELESSGLAELLMERKGIQRVMENKNDQDSLFVGKNLFFVPELDKKSGEWTAHHSHPLKIQQKTTQPPKPTPPPEQSSQPQIKQQQP